MNVAEILTDRAKEVAAFSALLFRKRPRAEDDDISKECVFEGARAVPQYRRPSSANVPLSSVVRLAKLRLRRDRCFARQLAAEEFVTELPPRSERPIQKKKRPLKYTEWCLLLRRRRRFMQRQRPTARRRRERRFFALRRGKKQPPLCDCATPSPPATSNAQRHLFVAGGRTAVLWLPSHWQLRRRFQYRVANMCIEGCSLGNDALSRPVTVRVAVPTKSQRKQHRVLQRWVARLSTFHAATKHPRRPRCKSTALSPPLCFAVERSHECVWMVQPREPGRCLSAEEVMDLLVMRTNGTPPVTHHRKGLATSATALGKGMAQPEVVWHRVEGGVFYGHMWSVKEDVDEMCLSRAGATSGELAATALLVPVVLLRNSLGGGTTYYLVAAAPVKIGTRARKNLDIRLVSHWNPCGVPKALCSMFELWCCADATSAQGADTTSSSDTSLTGEWIQRRIDAAVRKWRAVSGGCLSTNKEKEHQTTSISSLLAETTTMFIFPSLSPTCETVDHTTFFIHRCVMTVLVLSTVSLSQLDAHSSPLPSFVWRYRTRHFQLSRHLFASFTDATAWRSTRGHDDKLALAFRHCRTALGYTRSVRVIGEEERYTLLRLVGCPLFTNVSDANALLQTSRALRLRCTLSNAHQHVLLKFAVKGGREHQREGSALCVLRSGSPAAMSHIGTVTSTSFFSMRFGCRVAYAAVWDTSGWEMVQAYLRRGCHAPACTVQSDSGEALMVAENPGHSEAGDGGVCFFVSAPEKFERFLPFLRRAPLRSAPTARVARGDWRAAEAALCDEAVCIPVALVRLSGVK